MSEKNEVEKLHKVFNRVKELSIEAQNATPEDAKNINWRIEQILDGCEIPEND